MNDEEVMELMCKVEGFFCAEKVIARLEQQLYQAKKDQAECSEELKQMSQDYFRKNRKTKDE